MNKQPSGRGETQELSGKELLGLFFSRTTSPMWVYDAETLRFLFVNQAAIERYGYSEAEFLSKTLYDIRPPSEASALRESVDAAERGARNADSWLHLDSKGKPVWVRVHSIPVPEIRNRARMAWIEEVTDLVESRRLQQDLLQRYLLVSKATSDLIWDWDLDDNSIAWNEVLTSKYGYSFGDEEFDYKWWLSKVHPSERESVATSLHEATKGDGSSWAIEYRFQDREGRYHRVLDRGFLIRDDAGRVVRMIGSMLNLSDLRRIEVERDLMFQLSNDLMVLASLDGSILRVNPALAALAGVSEDDPDQFDPGRYLAPGEVPAMHGILDRLREGESVESFQLSIQTADGDIRAVEWSATPDLDHGFIVAIGRDVTDALAAREGLEKALADAQDLAVQAQAATRIQTEFLQNMSHELRTPMNGVIGMAQLLAQTPLNAEQASYVKILSQSSELLLQVLNDILDFARIESGKVEILEEEFDLAQTVQSVVELFSVSARGKGISLHFTTTATEGALAIGDAFRIRQILNNLVGNAVKFTHQGSIRLHLSHVPTEDGRCEVEISVEDTGIGIRTEQLEHIFERFTQADGSLSRSYGGTGLGLAIARGLAGRMGGTLEARSEIGRGSTFTLKLNLRRPEHSSLSQPPQYSAEDRSVLVVEDQELNSMILEAWLEKQGYRVTVATDGQQAIRAMSESRFDLMLLDIQVPLMDGYAIAKWVREREGEGRPRTPIIAVTASATSEDESACIRAGMDAFVAKPILMTRLDEVIRRVAAPA